jgi:hypothetical protein
MLPNLHVAIESFVRIMHTTLVSLELEDAFKIEVLKKRDIDVSLEYNVALNMSRLFKYELPYHTNDNIII